MSGSVAQIVQVLVTFSVLSALGMAAHLRIQSLVNAFAFQAWLVGLVLVLVGWDRGSTELWVIGALVMVLKGIAVPGALRRANRRADTALPQGTEPFLSLPSSVLVSAVLAVLGYAAGRPIATSLSLSTADAFPAGLTLALVGTFLMIVRGTAMTQVVGLLVVGNGILLVASSTTPALPLLGELAVAFEGLVVAVVFGMQMFGINRTFDNLRQARLLRRVPAVRRGKGEVPRGRP